MCYAVCVNLHSANIRKIGGARRTKNTLNKEIQRTTAQRLKQRKVRLRMIQEKNILTNKKNFPVSAKKKAYNRYLIDSASVLQLPGVGNDDLLARFTTLGAKSFHLFDNIHALNV